MSGHKAGSSIAYMFCTASYDNFALVFKNIKRRSAIATETGQRRAKFSKQLKGCRWISQKANGRFSKVQLEPELHMRRRR
jgi:hypothetical protein